MVKKESLRVNRTCVVCGNLLNNLQKLVCSNKECRLEQERRYNRAYREKNRDKVREWLKLSQRRRMNRRAPNLCKKCGIELPNYHRKYCGVCRKIRGLERQKNYYEHNKEKEVRRKALWFQKNKKRIWEKIKEKRILIKKKAEKRGNTARKKEKRAVVLKSNFVLDNIKKEDVNYGKDTYSENTIVKNLLLSTRAKNCLTRNKIGTLGELLGYSENDLAMLEGMGFKSIKEIKKLIGNYNSEAFRRFVKG